MCLPPGGPHGRRDCTGYVIGPCNRGDPEHLQVRTALCSTVREAGLMTGETNARLALLIRVASGQNVKFHSENAIYALPQDSMALPPYPPRDCHYPSFKHLKSEGVERALEQGGEGDSMCVASRC